MFLWPEAKKEHLKIFVLFIFRYRYNYEQLIWNSFQLQKWRGFLSRRNCYGSNTSGTRNCVSLIIILILVNKLVTFRFLKFSYCDSLVGSPVAKQEQENKWKGDMFFHFDINVRNKRFHSKRSNKSNRLNIQLYAWFDLLEYNYVIYYKENFLKKYLRESSSAST